VLFSGKDERYEFADVSTSFAGVIFGPDYPDESIPMVRAMLRRRGSPLRDCGT
jgi:hypothetical protein